MDLRVTKYSVATFYVATVGVRRAAGNGTL
jgi:hypothetical protein